VKNKKASSGIFSVFHIGKNSYVVENTRTNEVMGSYTSLSQAFAAAMLFWDDLKCTGDI